LQFRKQIAQPASHYCCLTVEPNKISTPVYYLKISGFGKASITNLNSGQPCVQDCV